MAKTTKKEWEATRVHDPVATGGDTEPLEPGEAWASGAGSCAWCGGEIHEGQRVKVRGESLLHAPTCPPIT